MEPALLEILREAVETKLRNEDLDRSLGRTLRRHDMDFELFVKMTSELREMSAKEGITVDDAAKGLLAKHKNKAD